MTHSFTYIDIGGNQAQYCVSDEDNRRDFHWSTDHGDRGVAATFEQAQSRARAVLKDSMAAQPSQRRSSPRRKVHSQLASPLSPGGADPQVRAGPLDPLLANEIKATLR